MQILAMNFSGSSDQEVLDTIKNAWDSCVKNGWRRSTDGSFEAALSDRGYYLACREAEKRGIEWKPLIEDSHV